MQTLDEIIQKAQQITDLAQADITNANDLSGLEEVRVQYLGKKSELINLRKGLGAMPEDARKALGAQLNQNVQSIEEMLTNKKAQLEEKQIAAKLASQTLDITLPARGMDFGSMHPVTKTRMRIEECFKGLGFTIAEGPEIEDDYHNFVALNIPEHHPARAMQDTFYFGNGDLLRTHTSPVQIREMQKGKPPFRLIATGRVYRCDYDITHTPMFHQVEGLMVDENLTLANLKSILTQFLTTLFEQQVTIRLRNSFFPFTEPSAEVDMQCTKCQGRGCRICSNTGWLEILGCGMVHPKVLEHCNIDSERYTGWAFGMGIDRVAMLRYGISDLRMMFENDLRFLQQF